MQSPDVRVLRKPPYWRAVEDKRRSTLMITQNIEMASGIVYGLYIA